MMPPVLGEDFFSWCAVMAVMVALAVFGGWLFGHGDRRLAKIDGHLAHAESICAKYDPPQASEVDLADLSMNDAKEWLDSPFWKVLHYWLTEEIDTCVADLKAGDIAIKSAGETGAKYRTDDTLRGGIIAFEFVRDLFPAQLLVEIEAAQHERAKKEQEEE